MVELSIIIPTIEEDDELVVLPYLQRCDYDDYEVIIRRDPGAAKARNEGIKRAKADKLVFLDDDSMPHDGYLKAVSEALDEHGAVVGRVLQPPDSPFKDKEIPWYDQGDEVKPTTLVPGCNMAMKREVLEHVGGFNEIFDHGHEETELAERITKDYDIYYHPEMVVSHYFAASVFEYWQKSYRHGKADVRQWELEGKPRELQLKESLPVIRPTTDPAEAGCRFARRFGRARGLLPDRRVSD